MSGRRGPRPDGCAWLPTVLGLAAGLGALGGCAMAPPPPAAPAELPFATRDQSFDLRWALQREAGRVRAVGVVTTASDREFRLTLALFGLDEHGRIVSRGSTHVQAPFTRGPVPFAITLAPSGREARFEVRVLDFFQFGHRN